jgi:hypothetical protein
VTKPVELREDDPDLLERFIEFLYTGNHKEPACGGLDVPESDGNALDSESDQEWQSPDAYLTSLGSKETRQRLWYCAPEASSLLYFLIGE